MVCTADSPRSVLNHPDVPQTWTVQNCTDHDTDSLRDIVENPNNAKSGDIVDLQSAPMLCNTTNSTITLTTPISGMMTVLRAPFTSILSSLMRAMAR